MKLQLLAIVFLFLSPATAANSSRRQRRTLSATAKKTSLTWLASSPSDSTSLASSLILFRAAEFHALLVSST